MARRALAPYEKTLMGHAGQELQKARKARRLSLRALAEQLRDAAEASGMPPISYSTIYAIEHAKQCPSWPTLCFLADFLGVPRASLIPGTPLTTDQQSLVTAVTRHPEMARVLQQLAETVAPLVLRAPFEDPTIN